MAFRQVVSEEERLQRIQQLLHSKIDEAREGDQQALLTDEGLRNSKWTGMMGLCFPPKLVDGDAHDCDDGRTDFLLGSSDNL